MNRRRFVVVAGLSIIAPVAVARAQTVPIAGECSVGFVNGLVQFSPDCPLLTPPGLGMEIAPPSHLAMPVVDESETQAIADEQAADDELRMQNKRDKQHSKRTRRRDRKREQRGRTTNRQQEKHERRRNRRDNGSASAVATPTP